MAAVTPYSAVNLVGEAGVDPGMWNRIPPEPIIQATRREIERRGIRVILAGTGMEALSHIAGLIPPGSEVMNGSSTTLIEIGYEELIRTNAPGWNLVHRNITAENDAGRRAELRRKSVAAEYFVSGVTALCSTGEILGCDASGSRVGAWAFAAGHLILVSGVNKIVPELPDALKRVREYAYPLENTRAKKVYGTPSVIGKCVILAEERTPGRTTLVLIREALGY